MRINREVLTNSMFNPKAADFARVGAGAMIVLLFVLTVVAKLVAAHFSSETFSLVAALLAAVAVFIFLEVWVIAAYERMMFPLRVVEMERALMSGSYARTRVAAQSRCRLYLRQYWSRCAVGADGRRHSVLTGHREAHAFEAYLIEIPRRPFLFRKWFVLPLAVVERA